MYSLDELRAKKRSELQKLCKDNELRATGKNELIIQRLFEFYNNRMSDSENRSFSQNQSQSSQSISLSEYTLSSDICNSPSCGSPRTNTASSTDITRTPQCRRVSESSSQIHGSTSELSISLSLMSTPSNSSRLDSASSRDSPAISPSVSTPVRSKRVIFSPSHSDSPSFSKDRTRSPSESSNHSKITKEDSESSWPEKETLVHQIISSVPEPDTLESIDSESDISEEINDTKRLFLAMKQMQGTLIDPSCSDVSDSDDKSTLSDCKVSYNSEKESDIHQKGLKQTTTPEPSTESERTGDSYNEPATITSMIQVRLPETCPSQAKKFTESEPKNSFDSLSEEEQMPENLKQELSETKLPFVPNELGDTEMKDDSMDISEDDTDLFLLSKGTSSRITQHEATYSSLLAQEETSAVVSEDVPNTTTIPPEKSPSAVHSKFTFHFTRKEKTFVDPPDCNQEALNTKLKDTMVVDSIESVSADEPEALSVNESEKQSKISTSSEITKEPCYHESESNCFKIKENTTEQMMDKEATTHLNLSVNKEIEIMPKSAMRVAQPTDIAVPNSAAEKLSKTDEKEEVPVPDQSVSLETDRLESDKNESVTERKPDRRSFLSQRAYESRRKSVHLKRPARVRIPATTEEQDPIVEGVLAFITNKTTADPAVVSTKRKTISGSKDSTRATTRNNTATKPTKPKHIETKNPLPRVARTLTNQTATVKVVRKSTSKKPAQVPSIQKRKTAKRNTQVSSSTKPQSLVTPTTSSTIPSVRPTTAGRSVTSGVLGKRKKPEESSKTNTLSSKIERKRGPRAIKMPDFDAIHERGFQKQKSIAHTTTKRTESTPTVPITNENESTSGNDLENRQVRKRSTLTMQHKQRISSSNVATENLPEKENVTLNKPRTSILEYSSRKAQERVLKKRASKQTSAKKTTAAAPGKKVFDLKASLSRPLSYKPKRGPLRPTARTATGPQRSANTSQRAQ